MLQAINLTATGDAIDVGDANTVAGLAGARLLGGGAAATAVLREGSGAGRILANLACAAGATDDFAPIRPVAFSGKVHLTLTGAGAACTVYF